MATLRAKETKKEGVLIIVDSFEKLRGDHTNVDDVRGSAENIFSRDWDLLKLPCPAIFTVPPWFCFLDASPESSTEVLPMCKLFDRGKSDLLEDGRRAFTDLFENHFVLSYRNGSRWFGLHPLVRRIPEVQAAIAESN